MRDREKTTRDAAATTRRTLILDALLTVVLATVAAVALVRSCR